MKNKIVFYSAIFLMVAGVVLWLNLSFSVREIPSDDILQTAEGRVSSLRNKNYSRGALNDLYIYLKGDEKSFSIRNVSKLKDHNGCYMTTLKIGDRVKIYYDPDDSVVFGEQNIIWKIESSGQIIVSKNDILFANQALDRYYLRQAILFIVMGIILLIVSRKMPWLLEK